MQTLLSISMLTNGGNFGKFETMSARLIFWHVFFQTHLCVSVPNYNIRIWILKVNPNSTFLINIYKLLEYKEFYLNSWVESPKVYDHKYKYDIYKWIKHISFLLISL